MTGPKLLNPKMVDRLKEAPRLSDMAYEAIREAIASRRIKPGEWLREEALAQEMGVSRPTVRDALTRLVAEGLAVHEPYKGVRTLAIRTEDVVDVYEMHALLEGLAVELAASRLSDEELAQMRELLPNTVPGADLHSVERAREANREFHWIAIRASGRRHLMRHLEQLWELIVTYALLHTGTERVESAKQDLAHHTALIEALEARDGKRARETITEHLEHGLATLLPRLQTQGQE